MLSFLPKRWRQKWLHGAEVSVAAALLSGGMEVVVFFDLLIRHYFTYANHWLGSVPDPVWMGGFSSEGEPAMMGLGVFVLIGFVLQPLTILLLYLSLEGAARGIAAALSGEIRGSLPLWLLAFGQAKFAAWREEKKLGPRVPDVVEPDGEGLRIFSCRSKPDWDDRVTISYRQMLYEVAGQEVGANRVRSFTY